VFARGHTPSNELRNYGDHHLQACNSSAYPAAGSAWGLLAHRLPGFAAAVLELLQPHRVHTCWHETSVCPLTKHQV
jgi:hypothetical protein